MRDGNTAGLAQRIGVGMWLAIGAALAVLAVQTVLMTAETTIVTELGAAAEAEQEAAMPLLPTASPNMLLCSGSDCPVRTTPRGTTEASTGDSTEAPADTSTGGDSTRRSPVTPASIPADGSALGCPDVGISGSVEITDAVAPCSDAIEALKATCTFNVSSLGYGGESEVLSDTAPAERGQSVSVAASAQDVETMEGAVLEQFNCPGGTTLTTRRGVYVE